MRVDLEPPAQRDPSRAGARASLTGGRLLARNTLFNLAGLGLPLLVALFAIPLLITGLGTERFGVLSLAWIAIGYFGLFDLGLGRALTQLVAQRLGSEEEEALPPLVWTALAAMLLLGIVGAALLALLSPWLVRGVLNIPAPLQGESLAAFYLLALALPFVISTSGLRAILEARQRFGLVNAVRAPLGILTYLGPLLVLPFSSSLVAVVAALLATRVLTWLVHLYLGLRVEPALRGVPLLRRALLGPLLRFGGWMTVTNVVSPLMTYLDRFFIGAMLSVSAVAYYVTPYEVVTKLLLVPGAVLGVLFPAFATSLHGDRERARVLLERSWKALFVLLFPVVLVLVALGQEALTLWVGAEFARNSTRVLQWLAVGVLINSVAQVPFTVLHGAGRPDLTAKLHLIELPLYVVAAWWLIGRFGIEGAAIAWVARVSLDLVLLCVLLGRQIPASLPTLRRAGAALGVGVLVLALAALPQAVVLRIVLLLVALVLFAVLGWRVVLAPEERALAHGSLARLRGRPVPSDDGISAGSVRG